MDANKCYGVCDIDEDNYIAHARDGKWALILMEDFIECGIDQILKTHRREELKILENIRYGKAKKDNERA